MKILFLLWFPFHHSFPSGSGIVGFHGYLGGGWVGDTSSLGLVAHGVRYPAVIPTSLHQHPGNSLCSHSVLEPLFPRICVFLFRGLIPYFGRAHPSGTFWEGVGGGKFWTVGYIFVRCGLFKVVKLFLGILLSPTRWESWQEDAGTEAISRHGQVLWHLVLEVWRQWRRNRFEMFGAKKQSVELSSNLQ